MYSPDNNPYDDYESDESYEMLRRDGYKIRNPNPENVAKEVIDLFKAVRIERDGDTNEKKMITALDKVKKEDIDTKDKDGNTLLILASDGGYTKVVQKLLKMGADVNKRSEDIFEKTPLLVASDNGFFNVLDVLLEYEADINAADTYGKTPLMLAVFPRSNPLRETHIKIAELLMLNGANVNAVDKFGFTPLMLVVINQFMDIEDKKFLIDLLIIKNAKINAVKTDGKTPLILSINKEKEIIEYLLDLGADALYDDDGDTIRTIAEQRVEEHKHHLPLPDGIQETELERIAREKAEEILKIIEEAIEKQKEKYIEINKQTASEVFEKGKTDDGKSLVPSKFNPKGLSDKVASYLRLEKVPGGKKKKTKKSKKSRKSNKKTRKH